jgi:HK97 gp10 family phage protein
MSEFVTTTGLSELRAAVDRLPAVVEPALQGVAQRTAERVADRARQHVPRRTGYTYAQIVVVHDPARHESRVEVGPTASHPATREHPLMLPAWLEFGTRYQPARPFMRPALDAEDARYRQELETVSAAVATQVFR